MPMLVYPVGLEVFFFVWAFIYIHTLFMWVAKAPAKLHDYMII